MSARLREAAHEGHAAHDAHESVQNPQDAGTDQPFVELRGVGRRGTLQPIDLDVHPGQILGLAGLLGSGRTETARLLFGADRADSGTILVEGRPVRLRSPRDAVRHGIGYCPEDRKKDGIVAELSMRENILLALQARRGWWRKINRQRARELADTVDRAARHQGRGRRTADRPAVRRQSAEGAARALARHRSEAADSRRTDARHRRRRQVRHHGSRAGAVRERSEHPVHFVGDRARCCA